MTTFDDAPPPQTPPAPFTVAVSAPPAVVPAPLEMGDDDTTAERLQVTSRFVTRDGEPWIPVMGEYHFSRDLPENWERELRKMKAGGISVLATYVLWIVHEEVRGEVRWDGRRDLRRFVETADRVGLRVMLRIGPWAHGETRNGGFPDWLQALPIGHRSDDPAYLAVTRRWYSGIEQQVRGLFHTRENPAGPIIGIQVDNELYDDGAHLATLRALAEEVGMRASLWTATGWGGAQLPRGRVLPVYAGYSDGFWEESDTGWPDFGEMHFTYSTVRDDLSVGADVRGADVRGADLRGTTAEADPDAGPGADDPWPFVTCELGGGMAVAYHRRPLVDPDDVAALALTKVGSGSAWQGYYMYHGGLQVLGELSSTQESQATGYPNDVPMRDYDFFAPLGTVGAQRPHFHALRQQHLLLDAFGAALAPAATTIPARVDGGPRWAVRSDGDRGFLFLNNHQPAVAALPDLDDVHFDVRLGDHAITVPTAPITVPAGAFAVWPLRQMYPDVPALTVTAQPITQITDGDRTVVLFAASEGIDVELQVEGVDAVAISGAEVRLQDGVVHAVPSVPPGLDCEVGIGDTTLVFLDRATAESVWRGDVAGRDTVILWPGGGWFDDDGFTAVLGDRAGALGAFPALRGRDLEPLPAEGSVFSRRAVVGGAAPVPLDVPALSERPTVPLRTGGPAGRFSAPADDDFADAATVEVHVPKSALETGDGERSVLTIDWTGDVMRVMIGDSLIADQFWYGRPFEIDLTPHREALAAQPLTLRAFAWAADSPVYVDPRVRPDGGEDVLEIRSAVVRRTATASFR